MSLESVARERAYDGDVDDGELIDFRVGRAHRTFREAVALLEQMLGRLNARPGAGINFPLIFDIVRAERAVEDAREALRSFETRAPPL